MSQIVKNVAPPKSANAVPLQAAVLLFGGAAAAALFGGGAAEPTSPQPETQPALVRRAEPLPAPPESPLTQLLGYVDEAPHEADRPNDALQTIGIAARPEPRTAAQREPRSMPLPFEAPPVLAATPVLTAAAGPAPRAKMQPYAAANSTAGGEATRPGLSPTPTNAARKHVVRDGDTLGGLAETYYGDARRYKELFAANRDVLSNPELLPIGATLQIPAFDPTTVRNEAPPVGARLVPQVLIRNP